MLKISLIECADKENKGSIGAFFIENALKSIGYNVDRLETTEDGYDVELISIHHCTDFLRLLKIKQKAKIRIIGGHPMQINPLPVIKYCDVVCVGEGETWIKNAVLLLEKKLNCDVLRSLPGTIICKNWDGFLPETNYENYFDNPPYLNYDDTKSKSWYIEIARGCPWKCSYCELSWTSKYRYRGLESIKKAIDLIDTKKTKKINIFAPDESSHPQYLDIVNYIKTKGFLSSFASMRLDNVLKKELPIQSNQLIRIGLDGLSERIRYSVNKKISNTMLFDYFKKMLQNGHCQFKIFMIFGYENETLDDFDEFSMIINSIKNIPLNKNVSLRIKWTPLIPQPKTPLEKSKCYYNYSIVSEINNFHKINRKPKNEPGFFIENDGLMSEKNHKIQCDLTCGDVNILNRINSFK